MTTVLVAGATGVLGSHIAHALTEQEGVTVRLLVRSDWRTDQRKYDRVQPLLAHGASAVDGDVLLPESLAGAVSGTDVVISALQGGPDVIVGGQIALAAAAAATGTRRFIPSDFAIDLFNAPAGAPQFEARKEADAAIEAMDLEVIHVLQGAFMDQMLDPSFPMFVDLAQRQIRFFGTGDELTDMTTVEDTARFTARVATDLEAHAGVHTISGAQTSFAQIRREIEHVTGIVLEPVSLGDTESLRRAIAAKEDPWHAVMEWYSLAMLTTPPLTNVENDRYPDARPTNLHDYLARAYAKADR